MITLIDSLIRIPPDAPAKVVALIRQALTIENPDYTKRTRMGLSTYNIPSRLNFLTTHENGWHTAPRGADAAELVKDACTHLGEPCQFNDQRLTLPSPAQPLPFAFELRDYQEAAVNQLTTNMQGVLQAPCGAGKTVMGCAAIARLGQPALILVHTTDLVDQWRDTIKEAIGGPYPAGIIAQGEQHISPITVATVQSLAKFTVPELTRIGCLFGVVLVDEAHHTPAKTFTDILSYLPAKRRYGVTATPEREDGLTALIGLTIGPVVHEVQTETLIEGGHLMRPEVRPIKTNVMSSAADYGGMIKELAGDANRIRVISNLLEPERSTLILSNRVDYCRRIAEHLDSIGCGAEALSGNTPKAKRKEILADFKCGALQILCATTLADEGLDVSRLECLIIALPSRAEGRTIQRLGRLMRPHPGKLKPVLYDLVDDHPIARRQWQARSRAYRKVLGADAVGRLR